MQTPGGGNNRRLGRFVDLYSLLTGRQVKAYQCVQFLEKIGRVGHVESSLCEIYADMASLAF
jgi:hypothetical protein